MGVLETAKIAVVVCARDRERAAAFYRDTLGLKLAREDDLATVFEAAGTLLTVSAVPDFAPHEHTIFGFRVADVAAVVAALRHHGVAFISPERLSPDALGVVALPGGIQVAWFKDTEGNVLSVSNL